MTFDLSALTHVLVAMHFGYIGKEKQIYMFVYINRCILKVKLLDGRRFSTNTVLRSERNTCLAI